MDLRQERMGDALKTAAARRDHDLIPPALIDAAARAHRTAMRGVLQAKIARELLGAGPEAYQFSNCGRAVAHIEIVSFVSTQGQHQRCAHVDMVTDDMVEIGMAC